ncbi:2OG-Fe(II) oxygenase [Sulfurimonas sp. SAG-AH-194-C20]|nr:2OG-Fe(II) oxygenase [Sulfurimonas sp. SAG-AH-194-C20]MDF1878061.1 2OG-Fe(II) oxygenase [Sulfurimonas sp. SAG-AH-194-C20]
MNQIVYEKITIGLIDNGYIEVSNVLSQALILELYEASTLRTYSQAGISSSVHQHLDSTRRSDKTSWLDTDEGAIGEYLEFCEGLKRYLNSSLYLGLSYYEAHFSIYEKGSFYEKHLDAFAGEKNRVITTLLYLNEEWNDCDGGELIIYDQDTNIVEKIIPKANTMVIFLSDKFPHEVVKTNKKRHSIAGWFRVDKR